MVKTTLHKEKSDWTVNLAKVKQWQAVRGATALRMRVAGTCKPRRVHSCPGPGDTCSSGWWAPGRSAWAGGDLEQSRSAVHLYRNFQSTVHSVTDCTACEVIAAASCTEEDGYFSCEYFETPSQTHTHTQTSLLLPPLCKYSSILHDSAEASLVVPEFTISVYGSSSNYLFWSQSLFFSFSNYFLAFHPALGMPINRMRKPRSDKETEKEKIAWTAVHRNYKIRDY